MAAPAWTGVLYSRPASVVGVTLGWYLVAYGNVDMGDGILARPGDGVQLTTAEATALGASVSAWTGPNATPATITTTEA